jgi:Arc/MetJ-type ribon-helix-helix transcriptional regulator
MSKGMVRTTVALPADLLEATDQQVREGKARSRNELLAEALRHELAARRRAEIDASFEGMGEDKDVRGESEQLEREFAHASWEAFLIGEAAYHGPGYTGPGQIAEEYRRADEAKAAG